MKTLLFIIFLALLANIAWSFDITCPLISCNYSRALQTGQIDPYTNEYQKTSNYISTDSSSGIFIDVNPGGNLNYFITNDTVNSKIKINSPANISIIQSQVNANSSGVHTIVSKYPSLITTFSHAVKGVDGSNSSTLCATNFKSGKYGTAAKLNFESRHLLPSDVCDSFDLNYLKTNLFSCSGTDVISPTPDVPVSILNQQRMCRADIANNVCAKKSYNLTCRSLANGPYCCTNNSTRVFSAYSDIIFPTSYFSSTGNCDQSLCGLSRNGIFFDKTVRVFGESQKVQSNCVMSPMTASFSDLSLSKSVTYTAGNTTRNAVDLTGALIIKNSSGTVIPSSNYRLIITNVAEIKALGLELRGCFNLNGSADNNYFCDIKPGPAVTIKMAAVDFNGNYSNEISTTVSASQMMIQWNATFNASFTYGWFEYGATQKCRTSSPATGTSITSLSTNSANNGICPFSGHTSNGGTPYNQPQINPDNLTYCNTASYTVATCSTVPGTEYYQPIY